jgi:MFS family permease
VSVAQRIAEFLGLKRNLVVLLIATFVIGAGEELWMRFLPKYLQALGATVFVIGLFDALRNFLGAIYAYPGGILVDRWGHRHAFIAFNVFSIIGYSLVLLIPHWAAVIAGMFLFLSWTCFSLPASFSLIGASLAANRYATGIGVQAVIKRLPIMIAPFLGGMLIDRYGIVSGVRVALGLSIVLSLLTIFVQRQLREEPTHVVDSDERWSFWQSVGAFNAPLRRMLLSDILVRFCERIPFAWTVIYVMDNLGFSARQFGVLTTIEMIAATLCIIPASHLADKYGREPFVIATFGFFTLFPLVLLYSATFPMLILAFTIRGLKEFGDAARKALIIGCSDACRRGQMVGAYYLIRDTLVSGAALLGAALWKFGPQVNFLSATAVGALGTLFYVVTLRRSQTVTGTSS